MMERNEMECNTIQVVEQSSKWSTKLFYLVDFIRICSLNSHSTILEYYNNILANMSTKVIHILEIVQNKTNKYDSSVVLDQLFAKCKLIRYG